MATSTQTIIAYFTSRGSLVSGLSPKLDIWTSTGTQAVNSATMTEIANEVGFYKYDFDDYDDTREFVFRTDGGSTLNVKDRYGYASNQAVPDSVTISLDDIKGDKFDADKDSLSAVSEGLDTVLDKSGGYWRIENNKMNFYNYNNNKLLGSVDLKDDIREVSEKIRRRYRG